jgi:formylglycine-generating enzyme required for sulfatase activity
MTSVLRSPYGLQALVVLAVAAALAATGCQPSSDASPSTTVPGAPVPPGVTVPETADPVEPVVPAPETPSPETPTPEEPETPTVEQPPAEEEPAPEEPPMAEQPETPSEEVARVEPPAEEPETPMVEQPPAEEEPAAEQPGEFVLTDEMDLIKVPTPLFMPKPVPLPESEAAAEEEMKPYTEEIPGTGVKFEMVPIKGGTFKMGSPADEPGRRDCEGPQVEVTIAPFWMGKFEVTWQEYELWGLRLDKQRRQLSGQEPTDRDEIADAITMPTPPYSDMTFGMGKEGYPAICMTQFSAKVYCKWLSAKTGRYYRLPTEAEWEYAARAGTTTAYSFGDDANLDDYAWHFDNADDKYHRVGQKKPNAWGLHDMHGNVAEWVLDLYDPEGYKRYEGKPVANPFVPATTLLPRVVRGGGWVHDPEDLRSAARLGSHKDWKMQDPQIPQSVWYLTDADFVGFRVVRPLRVPTAEEARKYEPDEVEVEEYEDYQKTQAGRM